MWGRLASDMSSSYKSDISSNMINQSCHVSGCTLLLYFQLGLGFPLEVCTHSSHNILIHGHAWSVFGIGSNLHTLLGSCCGTLEVSVSIILFEFNIYFKDTIMYQLVIYFIKSWSKNRWFCYSRKLQIDTRVASALKYMWTS